MSRYAKKSSAGLLNSMQSRATDQPFDLMKTLSNGALPPEMMGLGYKAGGSSGFSSVAHRAIQEKRLSNMVNDTTSDQIIWTVADARGKVTTPFEFNGKIYRPDKEGRVRIADNGKVALTKRIKDFRRQRVDKLMEIAMLGDEICQYIFGLSPGEWDAMTAKNGMPRDMPEDEMDSDLLEKKCSIRYIESLPPSLTQTQSIAKLRKIVEFYSESVNLEGLSDLADFNENIREGDNTIREGDISGPLPPQPVNP